MMHGNRNPSIPLRYGLLLLGAMAVLAVLAAGACKKTAAAQGVGSPGGPSLEKDGLMEIEPRRFAAEALPGLDGRRVDPAEDGKGRVVMINLWATWCPPCVEEMPSMERLATSMNGRDFRLYAVSEGESRTAVERFRAEKSQAEPSRGEQKSSIVWLLDPEQRMFEHVPGEGLPTTVLLDRSGRLRYMATGAIQWDRPSVVGKIEELIKE